VIIYSTSTNGLLRKIKSWQTKLWGKKYIYSLSLKKLKTKL